MLRLIRIIWDLILGVFLSLLTAAVREKQSHPRLTLLHN